MLSNPIAPAHVPTIGRTASENLSNGANQPISAARPWIERRQKRAGDEVWHPRASALPQAALSFRHGGRISRPSGECRLILGGVKVGRDFTEKDKRTRAYSATTTIEAGKVFLPEEAPWLAELKRELLGFPNTRHDDQVDSVVQFIVWQNRSDCVVIPFVVADFYEPSKWDPVR